MKGDDYYKALAFFQQRMLSYKTIGTLYRLNRKHAKTRKAKALRSNVKQRLKSRFRVSDIVKVTTITSAFKAMSHASGVPINFLLGATAYQHSEAKQND